MTKQVQQLDRVIIRFAGDSGDGMQLAGDRFTQETASFGNDLSTLPNFPAEIRAPAGTLPGVSSFQVHFADHDILTPGDAPDVLVAMNPAALKANLEDVPRGADIIANTDEFSKRNLAKVGYVASPLEDGSLDAYRLHAIPITSVTVKALENFDISRKDAERAKNMFALGLLSWLYNRPVEGTFKYLEFRFAEQARHPGRQQGRLPGRLELRRDHRGILGPIRGQACRADVPAPTGTSPATRRWPTAWSRPPARSGLPLFLGSYPITPASDMLHELSKLKRFGVRTMQAEDEISGVGAALGASFGGGLGVTTTSGPGMCLKAETIGLAVVGGAAADHLRHPARRAVHRHADQDRAGRPADGAVRPQRRVAGRDRRPVHAGRLLRHRAGGGADRGQVPHAGDHLVRRLPGQRLGAVADPERGRLPKLRDEFKFASGNVVVDGLPARPFLPFQRDPQTLARPWAVPGTPGLEHRIGGIEKADGAGTISYDPDNHDKMVRLRQAKIDGIAADIPPVEVDDPDGNARVLVLGWGSTYGSIGAAVRRVRTGRRLHRSGAPAAPVAVPGQPGRGAAVLRQGAGPRDQPRPARAAAARPLPGRRGLLQPGPRPAVQGRRAGRRHPGCDQPMSDTQVELRTTPSSPSRSTGSPR